MFLLKGHSSLLTCNGDVCSHIVHAGQFDSRAVDLTSFSELEVRQQPHQYEPVQRLEEGHSGIARFNYYQTLQPVSGNLSGGSGCRGYGDCEH